MKKEERESRIRRDKEFYARCSELLGIEHDWHVPFTKKNRWNARRPGNGRFPGFGTIQHFGGFIRVMSRDGTKTFHTVDEVYNYLNAVIAQ